MTTNGEPVPLGFTCGCNPEHVYSSRAAFFSHFSTHRHEAFQAKEQCRDLQSRLEKMQDQFMKSEKTCRHLGRRLQEVTTKWNHSDIARLHLQKNVKEATAKWRKRERACNDLERRLQEMETKWNQSERTCRMLRAHRNFLQTVMTCRQENALTHPKVPNDDDEAFEDAMTTVQEER